jgi:transcriptional regulator with PAS, ATPase and Fis domain
VVAAAKAIARELDLTATLKEKQSLVKQQNAILELVDTGIALIDREGRILRTNKALNDHEISVRLADKHTHLRVSTALIKDGGSAESKVTYTFQDILGKSPALLQCIKLAQNASRSNANVLILGASGAGKELFAQAIHNHSPRRLGIARSTVYNKMKDYRISLESFRGQAN